MRLQLVGQCQRCVRSTGQLRCVTARGRFDFLTESRDLEPAVAAYGMQLVHLSYNEHCSQATVLFSLEIELIIRFEWRMNRRPSLFAVCQTARAMPIPHNYLLLSFSVTNTMFALRCACTKKANSGFLLLHKFSVAGIQMEPLSYKLSFAGMKRLCTLNI